MKQLTQQQINQLMIMHQKGLYAQAISEANKLIKIFPKELLLFNICLLYTSPSPRDVEESRMPSSA